jgi:hypothetical protein
MAVDPKALWTECMTDPRSYGYAALRTAQDWVGLAEQLNLVRAGAQGTGAAIVRRRATIQPQELQEAFHTNDFLDQSPLSAVHIYRGMYLLSLLLSARPLRLLDATGANTRVYGNIKRLLVNSSASETRLDALANENISRATELWGGVSGVVAILGSEIREAFELAAANNWTV